ncbi:hypothetical protein EHV15_35600 [Paenibacillus oralis]|uniref:Uncharacterized protein n=1 Tax=Paenibacillus oralis TaxID=2490856 RepID=A0A3P3TBK4_9BACL|nr:hypothetical protein [Paenibacillus oralis]RRJ54899.1 hypothetical protein EHV15_35600 [Paenibacillus oralis]
MPERLYSEIHYQGFLDRLSQAHVSVLNIVTDNNLIPKKDIIDKLSDIYSKNPIVNAIDALLFAGLISFKYVKKQHQFYLSEDGKAFNDYATRMMKEE